MVVSGFYENVPQHLYEKRELKPDEKAANMVLQFNPRPVTEMLVACLWDLSPCVNHGTWPIGGEK